jgi:hypothetical protein
MGLGFAEWGGGHISDISHQTPNFEDWVATDSALCQMPGWVTFGKKIVLVCSFIGLKLATNSCKTFLLSKLPRNLLLAFILRRVHG